ncbi:MAG: hypothetical protein EAZ92_03355 [Candidatus Kapaibacterium sp.]|nr:MAG: hypothetical protein EAZ92_03355 [Candidatus Kapabacteria bacterium]
MIERDDSLPKPAHPSLEQPTNPHFFADEARSGFDADMESFGAFTNTKFPPPPTATELPPPQTYQEETLAGLFARESEKLFAQELPSPPQTSLQELSASNNDTLVVSQEETSDVSLPAPEVVSVPHQAVNTPETSREGFPKETPPEDGKEAAKPLSEAQRLADMLTANLFESQSPPAASSTAGLASSSALSLEDLAANVSNVSNVINSEANERTVISIPSESEIVREQQRQLRKKELLDHQHRKKDHPKGSDQFGDEALRSRRVIAAIVMSLLLGALSLAGFFAWRNPSLRLAGQDAWSKLTGKPQPPINADISSDASSGVSSENSSHNAALSNTNAGTNPSKQPQSNTSASSATAVSAQADSGVVPLDLTQSGASRMTVAAQDSLNAVNSAVPNSSSNAGNTSSNIASNVSNAPNDASSRNVPNTASQKNASPKTNAEKTTSSKSSTPVASQAQSSDTKQSHSSSPQGKTSSAAIKTTPAALPSEKSSSTKPVVVAKEDAPKTASQSIVPEAKGNPSKASAMKVNNPEASAAKARGEKPNGEKPNGEKPSGEKSGLAKTSTLPKAPLEKPNAPYTSNGVFAIQVYASPSQADAEDWVERLRKRGFVNPSMSSQLIRGQLLYRVRFGLYNNLRQAEQDAERYGFAGAWVVRLR